MRFFVKKNKYGRVCRGGMWWLPRMTKRDGCRWVAERGKRKEERKKERKEKGKVKKRRKLIIN